MFHPKIKLNAKKYQIGNHDKQGFIEKYPQETIKMSCNGQFYCTRNKRCSQMKTNRIIARERCLHVLAILLPVHAGKNVNPYN